MEDAHEMRSNCNWFMSFLRFVESDKYLRGDGKRVHLVYMYKGSRRYWAFRLS